GREGSSDRLGAGTACLHRGARGVVVLGGRRDRAGTQGRTRREAGSQAPQGVRARAGGCDRTHGVTAALRIDGIARTGRITRTAAPRVAGQLSVGNLDRNRTGHITSLAEAGSPTTP